MNYQNVELISHHLCPHMQRCVNTLIQKGYEKNVDFKVTYLDIRKIPDWYFELSPTGNMPALRLEEGTILTRSDVISEFLDDMTSGSLQPTEPLQRARHKLAIVDADRMLDELRQVFMAKNEATLNEAIDKVFGSLEKTEEVLEMQSQYFSNGQFSLVDASFAPMFTLMFEHEALVNDTHWEDLPKTRHWAESLLQLNSVQKSKAEDYNIWFDRFFEHFDSYFPSYQERMKVAG